MSWRDGSSNTVRIWRVQNRWYLFILGTTIWLMPQLDGMYFISSEEIIYISCRNRKTRNTTSWEEHHRSYVMADTPSFIPLDSRNICGNEEVKSEQRDCVCVWDIQLSSGANYSVHAEWLYIYTCSNKLCVFLEKPFRYNVTLLPSCLSYTGRTASKASRGKTFQRKCSCVQTRVLAETL